MNIGFVWIYHWTGLYKQKSELQKICLDNDINASELICDGDLDFCYTKERSKRPGFITCTVCKLRRRSSTILKDQHKLIYNHSKDIKPNYEFAKSSLNTLIDSDDPEILNNPIISKKK